MDSITDEELQLAAKSRTLLILDCDSRVPALVWEKIKIGSEDLFIQVVDSVEEYRLFTEENPVDITILGNDWNQLSPIELIYHLKTTESRPAVIVIAPEPNHQTINELYKHGIDRCIVRDDGIERELSIAVKQLLNLRKAIEANEEARTRLTEANRLLEERTKRLDEFSATVAHDIRGPLGGICMKLEYLKDVYQEDIDDRFSEILNRALQSSHRLTEVVQAMYEFAKLGKQAAVMRHFDLETVLDEVITDMDHEGFNVEIRVSDMPRAWGNASLIRRVLLNLVQNAIKYNDKELIEIEVGYEGELSTNLGRFAKIYVKDNGPGIEEGAQKTLFGMFQRGWDDKTKTVEGAGIGLAVVQRIVELHYGVVGVESEPGKGSTFYFTIPLDVIHLTS